MNATLKISAAEQARRLLGAAAALAGDDRLIPHLLAGNAQRWESPIRGSGAAIDAMRHARAAYALAVAGDADALDELEAAADALRAALAAVADLRAAVG